MWPFRKQNVSLYSAAIKDGRLVNMQRPPFRQFNKIVQNDYEMVMTKAVYQACVQLPGESKRKVKVPANARWGILYLSFVQAFQNRKDDPTEGIFDVSVMMPDGFQIPQSVKVVADHDFGGKDAFIFMMPDEIWPDCARS